MGQQCYGAMGAMEGYREEEGPTPERVDDTETRRKLQKASMWMERTGGRWGLGGVVVNKITGHLCENSLRAKHENTVKSA